MTYRGKFTRYDRTYRLRQWLADVPLVSLLLLKLCPSDGGGGVFHAEWRWRRCAARNDGMDRP